MLSSIFGKRKRPLYIDIPPEDHVKFVLGNLSDKIIDFDGVNNEIQTILKHLRQGSTAEMYRNKLLSNITYLFIFQESLSEEIIKSVDHYCKPLSVISRDIDKIQLDIKHATDFSDRMDVTYYLVGGNRYDLSTEIKRMEAFFKHLHITTEILQQYLYYIPHDTDGYGVLISNCSGNFIADKVNYYSELIAKMYLTEVESDFVLPDLIPL